MRVDLTIASKRGPINSRALDEFSSLETAFLTRPAGPQHETPPTLALHLFSQVTTITTTNPAEPANTANG